MIADSLKIVTDSLQAVQSSGGNWGLANINANHGFSITWSGMLVVFLGLGLIALTISAFNLVSDWVQKRQQAEQPAEAEAEKPVKKAGPEIPADHLIAITTAVELYRRLHLDPIPTRVTFVRGELHTPWKTGIKYGQRIVPEKRS